MHIFSLEGPMAVTFEDVVVYFSPDEWQSLTEDQKQLYWEVLQENYHALLLVGRCPITPEEVLVWVQNNERLNILISSRPVEDSPVDILSKGDEDRSQMDAESFPEKAGSLESIFTLSKEEAPCCRDVERHPEQSRVLASEQGGHLQTESAERASADASTEDVPLPCGGWVEPVVVPEKSTELPSCPRRTTILPRCDFVVRAEHPIKEMQLARITCDENCVDSRSWFCPPGDEDRSQMDAESFPEKAGPLGSIFTLSKEVAPCCSDVEGHPEQSRVSASEQGGHLRTESAERASAGASTEDVPLLCGGWFEPVVAAETHSKLPSCARRTTLPRRNFAVRAEHPVKEMQLARTTCDKNWVDSRRQALARSAGKMQDTPSSSPEAPTKEEKFYSCPWCKEPFKLRMNLEVHYRYCRQRGKQQPQTTPGGQAASEASRAGKSTGSVHLPEKPVRCPSSAEGKEVFLHFRLCQPHQRQRVGKSKGVSDAGRGSAESPRSLMTTSATKRLCRCPECGERFVYKWQLSAHRQGCRKVVENKKDPLPKPPRDFAAKELSDNAKGRQACVAVAGRRGTKDTPLYPCGECGKSLSKCYLSTHLAFHAGLRYKCLLCGKVLNFRSGAARHKRQHCEKEEGGTCPKCGRRAGANDCFCMIQRIRIAPDSECEERAGLGKPK